MDQKYQSNYYKFTFFCAVVLTVIFSLFTTNQLSNYLWYDIFIGLNWLVFFYWFPLWMSGYFIFKLRANDKNNFVIEFLIVWLLFFIGYAIKDMNGRFWFDLQGTNAEQYVVVSLSWAVIFYSIMRSYEYSVMLISSTLRLHRARQETLRYQLNPHLLFNSLNTISAMIYTDPNKADSILHDLASLLRFSLDLSENEKIPLEAELALIGRYINIEKARFGELLTVSITTDDKCLSCLLPPLIIQPLIENSIKHNSKNQHLDIHVNISLQDNKLKVEVLDNGKGFPQAVLDSDIKQSVGLKNLQAQVNSIPQSTLTLENYRHEDVHGAKVTLLISQ